MSPALRCPSCGAPADDASQACASCDTPLPWHAGETYLAPEDPDATRLTAPARSPFTPPRTGSSTRRAKPLSHSSGWAGTSSDIDHGRFEPGAITAGIAALIMPGLMIVVALLARRNVKLGRGDRRGAVRAATAVFVLLIGAWLLGNNHVGQLGIEVDRFFAAAGVALFNAALVWLAYLGVEPYVRRFSADALIGWSGLIAGNWRDPRVARDVMIGVAVGVAMTVAFAAHNLLPPLFGRPEPMPSMPDPNVISTRYALAKLLQQLQSGA